MILSNQMTTMMDMVLNLHYVIIQTNEQEFQHAGVSCAAKRRKRRRRLEDAMHGEQLEQEKQQDPDNKTTAHAKTDDATPPQHPQQGNAHYNAQEQPTEMHDDLDPRMFEEILTKMCNDIDEWVQDCIAASDEWRLFTVKRDMAKVGLESSAATIEWEREAVRLGNTTVVEQCKSNGEELKNDLKRAGEEIKNDLSLGQKQQGLLKLRQKTRELCANSLHKLRSEFSSAHFLDSNIADTRSL